MIRVPTIGIGSGKDCDGQILVTYDLLGMFPWFKPKFVEPKAQLAPQIQTAVGEYIRGHPFAWAMMNLRSGPNLLKPPADMRFFQSLARPPFVRSRPVVCGVAALGL